MNIVNIYEVSQMLGIPEFLIRDFVSYDFNGKKLNTVNQKDINSGFDLNEILAFKKHLEEPWPGSERIPVPDYIQRYLIFESQAVCSLCKNEKSNYEYAHINPWAKYRNHSPHNILRLCLDCHKSYGNDRKLLSGVKEDLLRKNQLYDSSLIYECDENVSIGDAVYVQNEKVFLSQATSYSKLAIGFIKTKIGLTKCLVQRSGVVIGIPDLMVGEYYFLSLDKPGKIELYKDFEASRKDEKEEISQRVGRAESLTHLAINFGEPIGLSPR